MDEDQKAIKEIMRLIRDMAKDYVIEQTIRHALQDAYIRGTKWGMKMTGG